MDRSLPEHLDERIRWWVSPDHASGGPGQFVLYWMHTALRAHENPALDSAICLARQNGLPLLVYHGLSEQYPYACDRHHAFILQGHRDVQRQLSDRGIVAAFHLQRQGNRGPYLRDLTRAAAVLVTEEMPVPPVTGWLERLSVTTETPIATVDCSCLAPVTLVDRSFTRAAEFRREVQPLHEERLQRPYVEQDIDVSMCDLDWMTQTFGLSPLCLQDADLAKLIGQCRIDHTVAPVADTPGGSRAGYARWKKFREQSLRRYGHARRNAARRDGTSRMSAYLHYGMVSPFRIAREAAAEGATKYLDELLTWRELSFHFCFHHRDEIDSLDSIPDWARTTLRQHAKDPREEDCSWERLARGNSGRPLWDAAQRSLLKHGELHNDLRMTWGKAFLPWASSPERALQLTLDLNHRYALDGRNPSSFGGVLWCYGQFDHPFDQDRPILGTIRPRCLEQHAERLDLQRFTKIADRPIAASLPRVAIVGAGMAGLTAARTLSDHGIDVTVFDKSRGVGGRMSTRRVELPGRGVLRFDHGAQYFTARDGRFCRLVNSWMHDGLAQPWLGRIVQLSADGSIEEEKRGTARYVGVPGMNQIAKHLAADLVTRLRTPITRVAGQPGSWTLHDQSGETHGPFEIVLCNCPPDQTLRLIDGISRLAEPVRQVEMRPCWAVMLAADCLGDLPFDGAFVQDSPISWIASDHAKPGRDQPPTWMIHASADWSLRHLECDPEMVSETLVAQFRSLVGREAGPVLFRQAHRWRYAVPASPLESESLYDATEGIGVCGDWCGGARIEAAYLSGSALAGAVLRDHTIDRPAWGIDRPHQPSLFAS
ncbi:FAD-dependent oxidoreductase [Roseiconus nitratireducens]|uniref:FAD-dependent oxidoreductase n=1 Tax=Roseiconus nitratireducens TaxID=2605748 RepID=A0A5M6DAE8_9BACT|nr:FAD-dependent oxidoreductase [Roseiconus nitratireducens]KAA5544511.1 FAD-dependent oxidoreductase [Roseiconus nitratireducens]